MKNAYDGLTAQAIVEHRTLSSAAAGCARMGARGSTYEDSHPPQFRFTAREREVLKLLCAGLPNKLISRTLGISGNTTKCHVAKILRELGVTSRLQAVVWAQRYNLIDDDDGAASASVQAGNT